MEWLGVSLPTWERAFYWLTGIAALCGGISVVCAAIAGVVGWKVTDVTFKDADRRIAEADVRAAEANERAAQADLARVELQKQIGWRDLDGPHKAKLVAALRAKKFPIELNWASADPECENYARLLRAAFEEAGYDVRGQALGYQRLWGLIGPIDDPQDTGDADHLRAAFAAAGIEYRARMDHPTTDRAVVIVASRYPVGAAQLIEGPIRSVDSVTGDHVLQIKDGHIAAEIPK